MDNQREKHSRVAKKAKKQSRLTGGQKVLVVIAVLLAIALVAVIAFKSVFVRPDLKPGSGTEQEEEIDWGDGVRPKADGTRKSKDFYTILVLGRDTGGGGNTDTMLLASYDVTNQKAAVMSIPRDTMVNVPWDVKKINSVYGYYGGGDKGLNALYKEISQLVGFAPDYQVVVEWEAVGAIVDAIGGVWFDNPYPMDFHDPGQDLVIEQAPGYRLLTGEDAMQVIRWRGNDPDSPYGYQKHNGVGGIGDTGRMELQQDFLKAAMKQLLRPENVKNIGKIIQVFEDNVETDLSFQNILWFGQQFVTGGLNPDDVQFMTMPWNGVSAYSRTLTKQLGRYFEVSYVVPRADELLELVNTHLSPYVEPFTRSDLDIMYKNKDGTVGSTTGHVEDSKATEIPVKPEVVPEGEAGELPEGMEPGDIIVVDPELPLNPDAPIPGSPEDLEEGPDAPMPMPELPTEKPDPAPEQKPEPDKKPEKQPQQPAEPPKPTEPEQTKPETKPEQTPNTEPTNPPADDSGFVIIGTEPAA